MPAPAQSSSAIPTLSKDEVSVALERTLSRYATAVRDAARRHGLAESELDEIFQEYRDANSGLSMITAFARRSAAAATS